MNYFTNFFRLARQVPLDRILLFICYCFKSWFDEISKNGSLRNSFRIFLCHMMDNFLTFISFFMTSWILQTTQEIFLELMRSTQFMIVERKKNRRICVNVWSINNPFRILWFYFAGTQMLLTHSQNIFRENNVFFFSMYNFPNFSWKYLYVEVILFFWITNFTNFPWK